MQDKIQKVEDRLKDANCVLAVTGAGISAESGIPTFRGKEGYWRRRNPMDLASPEGFQRDPKLVWEWYNYRRRLIASCGPNPGHRALAELEKKIRHFLLITQNVDGLHRLAGNCNIVEIHGSIWRVRPAHGGGEAWEDRNEYDDSEMPLRDADGQLLRPDVVWFGEMLPTPPLRRIDEFFSQDESIDLCFVIGTSAAFSYILNYAYLARERGALIVEINPEPGLPPGLADITLAGKSGEILPKVCD